MAKKRTRSAQTLKSSVFQPLAPTKELLANRRGVTSESEEFPDVVIDHSDDDNVPESSDNEDDAGISADEDELPLMFKESSTLDSDDEDTAGDDEVSATDDEGEDEVDSGVEFSSTEEGVESDEIESGSSALDSDTEHDDEEEDGDRLKHDGSSIKSSGVTKQAKESKTVVDWQEYVESRKIFPEIVADYDSDTSTEENTNTVGNIPMEWYEDYPHIGYDLDGKRIMKPATQDELDKLLANMDNPDSMITIPDKLAQEDVKLTDKELDIIHRLEKSMFPDSDYNPYEPTVEWFTSQTELHPLSGVPEPKRRFLPSKWEAKKVVKIVRAIRAGHIVLNRKPAPKPRFYAIWNTPSDDSNPKVRGIIDHLPAPKQNLPGHAASYHPPKEYLPTPKELAELEEKHKNNPQYLANLPQDYGSLRHVPAYPRFIQERFQRCLDLYLCPRVAKKRDQLKPSDLIPQLPDPKELRPFPTRMSIIYRGHTSAVRSVSVDPSGYWLLTGSDDHTVRLWEIATGRCAKVWQMEDGVTSVVWNPRRELCMFAVAVGRRVYLMTPPERTVCHEQTLAVTREILAHGGNLPDIVSKEDEKEAEESSGDDDDAEEEDEDEEEGDAGKKSKQKDADKPKPAKGAPKKRRFVHWLSTGITQLRDQKYVIVQHTRPVRQVVWHHKGDYFSTVCSIEKGNPQAGSAVLVHSVTKFRTQRPIRRTKGGPVQQVCFHPTQPWFIVATQRLVRIYDLLEHQLVKTLAAGAQWISSVDVHPQGDNILVGSFERRLQWFDLDLGSKPFKNIRFHQKGIRQVRYHSHFPLFASASDDCTLQVFHGRVYRDLLQNPLIVPVKILRGHTPREALGVLDCIFHPTQPWLFSCGADGTARLWS
ncbi:Ribosome biogenesis protein erb1 [Dispira simplex]|nr:Ribosome biogenesis protein erb1 [Dispira simplex]